MQILPRHYRIDLALGAGLLLAALLVRWPDLYLIPRFTDEVYEIWLSLDMLHGKAGAFASIAPYMGPIYSQLLAVALGALMNPWVPRGLVMVLASLTIPAVYWVGRLLYGRGAGLIAAALLVTSSAHIVVSSHTSIANSLTPLFSVLSIGILVLARRSGSAWALGAFGIMFALAGETHPLAFSLAPGLVIWFFSSREQWNWFRRPGLYLATGAAFLVYSPVLLPALLDPANFRAGLESRGYAFASDRSPGAYLGNLQNFGIEMVRMLGAIFPNLDAPRDYILRPLSLGYAALILGGVIHGLRGAGGALVWGLVSACLLIPFLNYQYGDYPYFARYVTFLLPIICILAGAVPAAIANRLRERWHSSAPARVALLIATAIGVAALVIAPLFAVQQYYDNQVRSGRSNLLLLDIAQRVTSTPDAQIYLDHSLVAGEFPNGGNLLNSFQLWFDLSGQSIKNTDLSARVPADLCTENGYLITADQVVQALNCRMTRITGAKIPTRPGFKDLSYSLFQIETQ